MTSTHSTASPVAARRAPDSERRGSPWATLAAVAVGVMMVALDGTVVAVANPVMGRDLKASLSDLQWITNGYLLGLAVSLVAAGKFGDRYGHKVVYLAGVVGFALSSLGIGLSGQIATIIVLRVAQGLFGALLQPAALGLLRAAFAADRLNLAIGIWAGVIGTSTAAGPIVGGLLVEHVSWQSVFFVNVPVGAAAVLTALRVLPCNRPAPGGSRIDIPGVLLLSAGLFVLVWALIKAPAVGWTDARTLGLLGAALALGVAFAGWQRRSRAPLLPPALFRSVSLSLGVVLTVVMAFAMFGALFFVTFYLQGVRGLSPVAAGVWMLPLTLLLIVGSPLGGVIAGRFGPRPPVVGGMFLAAVALLALSRLHADSGVMGLAPWFALLGLGLSSTLVAATEAVVGHAPADASGVASGLQQTAMQTGGALGTAVLSAVMTARVGGTLGRRLHAAGVSPLGPSQMKQAVGSVAEGAPPPIPHTSGPLAPQVVQAGHLSFLDGMSSAFVVAAALAALAALVGLWIRPGHRGGEVIVHV